MGQVRAKSMIERVGFKDPELATPQHDEIVKWIERNIEDLLQTLFPAAPWPEADIESLRNKIKLVIDRQRTDLEKRARAIQKKLDSDSPTVIAALKVFGGRQISPEYEKIQEELKLMDNWGDLGTPPEVPLTSAGRKWWEYTIKHREAVVGFVDYAAEANLPYLTVKGVESGVLTSRPKWATGIGEQKMVYFEAKVKIPSLGELLRQIRYYQTYEPGIYVVVSPDDREANTLQSQGISFIKCPAPSVEKKQGQQSLFQV